MEYSESVEMYLKEIYRLSKKDLQIRVTDIANALTVSKASVNRAVKRLCREGLLYHVTYGHIELTDKGRIKARETCEKQGIIAAYLVKALGIDPQLAIKEACKLEHVMSTAVIKKMKKATGAKQRAVTNL